MNNKLVLVLVFIITLLMGVIIGLLLRTPPEQTTTTTSHQETPGLPAPPVNLGSQASAPPTGTPAMPKGHSAHINEWINNTDGLHGYSLYFENTAGGRFILEKCRAFTYADADGKPALPTEDFCQPMIDAAITHAKDNSLTLANRQDSSIQQVALKLSDDKKVLLVTFQGEKISFTKGSRNDLLQIFEANPKTIAAKNKMLLNRPEPPR